MKQFHSYGVLLLVIDTNTKYNFVNSEINAIALMLTTEKAVNLCMSIIHNLAMLCATDQVMISISRRYVHK